MRYLMLAILLSGCSVQNAVLNQTGKLFDQVEYNYKRQGNTITRELKASGIQKVDIDGIDVVDIVAP